MSVVVEEMWIDNQIQRTLYKADDFSLPDAALNINEEILELIPAIPFTFTEDSISFNQAPQWVAETFPNIDAGYNYHSVSAYMGGNKVPLINSINQIDFGLDCTITEWLPVYARKYNLDDNTMSYKAMGAIDQLPVTFPVTVDLATAYVAVGYSEIGVADSSKFDLYFKATAEEMATIATHYSLPVPKVSPIIDNDDYFGITFNNVTKLPIRFKFYNFA